VAQGAAGQVFSEAGLHRLVIKPSCQGSSVGLQFAERPRPPAQLRKLINLNRRADRGENHRPRNHGRDSRRKCFARVEVRPRPGTMTIRTSTRRAAPNIFVPQTLIRPPSAASRSRAGRVPGGGGRDYSRVDVMVRCGWLAGRAGSEHPSRHDRDQPVAQAAAAAGSITRNCASAWWISHWPHREARLKAEQLMAGSTVVMTTIQNVV